MCAQSNQNNILIVAIRNGIIKIFKRRVIDKQLKAQVLDAILSLRHNFEFVFLRYRCYPIIQVSRKEISMKIFREASNWINLSSRGFDQKGMRSGGINQGSSSFSRRFIIERASGGARFWPEPDVSCLCILIHQPLSLIFEPIRSRSD